MAVSMVMARAGPTWALKAAKAAATAGLALLSSMQKLASMSLAERNVDAHEAR